VAVPPLAGTGVLVAAPPEPLEKPELAPPSNEPS
jgi:hypothetical protein